MAVSEARSWGLYGACQDASLNLYTASYYPTSTKLRVSKRSATNTGVWVHDITPPAGFKYGGSQVLRVDGSGNLYIGTTLSNTTTSIYEFQVLKLDSSGTVLNSVIYAPGSTGQTCGITGLVLDSSGNVYICGSYDTGGTSPVGFIRKYTSSLGGGTSQAVTLPAGYRTIVDDLVADGSGNVYVSASGSKSSPVQVASTVYKWDSTFASAVWQQTYTLGSNALPPPVGAGCLEIDSSSNVTYLGMYSDTNYSGSTNIYAVQYTSAGAQNWATQPALPGMVTYWTMIDSSGNLVVAGTSSASNYQIAKFNGATGALTWSTTRSASGVTPTVCQDASGDYLVVSAQTISGVVKSVVDRFTGSTGAYSTSYTYSSGASGADYGERVFPSGTAGTFFVFGIGLSGGTYYPLCYRAGTSTWTAYQTAVIP